MKKLTLVCRLLFYVCVCGVIINFVNLFRQMPVNTRRQTAGLSPLIKFSKKTKKKKIAKDLIVMKIILN